MHRLSSLTSAFVEGIKINRVWREIHGKRKFWLKRRKRTAWPVLAAANIFFRQANATVQTLTDVCQWQRWETDSFLGLHGNEGFQAFTQGERTIGAEELPGINATIPLDDGSITPSVTAAVGRELSRVHEWSCPEFDGPWSHGDPHAGNFIYDPELDRARIIDFEVMHLPTLSVEERHIDDVLTFLQDIVGRIRADQWLPCAQAFLDAYDRADIVERVLPRLLLPRARSARLWWRVRTSFLPVRELEERLRALREVRAVEISR